MRSASSGLVAAGARHVRGLSIIRPLRTWRARSVCLPLRGPGPGTWPSLWGAGTVTGPGLCLTQPAAHSAPGCPLGTPGRAADLPHPRVLTGHGDYGYQQSYSEQGYDRPFEESTQHYYEGGEYTPRHTPWPGMGGSFGGRPGPPRGRCELVKQERVGPRWGHGLTDFNEKAKYVVSPRRRHKSRLS